MSPAPWRVPQNAYFHVRCNASPRASADKSTTLRLPALARRSRADYRRAGHRALAPTPSCRTRAAGRSRSMSPTALADLVGGLRIDAIFAAHPPDQLLAKLDIAGISVMLSLHLPQPLVRSTDHQIVKTHTLTATSKRIKRFPNPRRLSDGMARMACRHAVSVAPGTAPCRCWFLERARTSTTNPAQRRGGRFSKHGPAWQRIRPVSAAPDWGFKMLALVDALRKFRRR
jgi:hypothetical protein